MAVFKVETKNKVDIDKKPRVYFTCHPDDFEIYFKKLCDDIFKTHDCAVYFTEDMSETIAEDEKDIDLGRNNLFVVPVTFKLLTTYNRAMDEDIPYALKEHIPVLPIMMESGIDEFYSKPDKFGELQYLNPYSTDSTEISYEEKLKKYLEAVLISEEMAKRIRAAFDAYIFLSYRKKDRKYANELMQLIHSNPECRDIAIWFDEFLTPGESFKKNIDRILHSSELFTLLVTPNLLEEPNGNPNFVMGEEYPAAQKSGITILPTEMVATDKNILKEKFKNIPDCVNPQNNNFHTLLLDAITKIATKTNNTPEHNFLIGLAYLDGIDVEVNRRYAVDLITDSAEAGLPEAMKKLYNMYSDGVGVALDYRKAVIWAENHAEYMVNEFGEEHPDTLTSLHTLGFANIRTGNHKKALELNEKVYTLRCKILGENHPDTLLTLNNLAHTYGKTGNFKKEFELNETLYTLRYRTLGKEHPDTLLSLSNLAQAYYNSGDYKKATELNEQVYALRCKILGDNHPDTLMSLSNLALTYGKSGNFQKELELNKKLYTTRCEILGKEHPDTLTSLSNLALSYHNSGNYTKSLEHNEKVYTLRCKVLGSEHPDTLITLNNLAIAYGKSGNFKKELEIIEKLYAVRCKISGKEHPDTLLSLHNIAYAYYNSGNYNKSAELNEQAYILRCKVLGQEHPGTLLTLYNLAHSYYHLGKYKPATELHEKVYTLRLKVLGVTHPDTIASIESLMQSYLRSGKIIKAFKLVFEHENKREQQK